MAGYCFNPRSHEGSDWLRVFLRIRLESFNPRSHEGSDDRRSAYSEHSSVSIHAPTKGATILSVALSRLSFVSIHAPTKGATIKAEAWNRMTACFNPRSHEGSDWAQVCTFFENTWFQSTLPRRERQQCGAPVSVECEFQSTLPRRERHCTLYDGIVKMLFQSTLPRRERPYGYTGNGVSTDVSIHAPTKGATVCFALAVCRL